MTDFYALSPEHQADRLTVLAKAALARYGISADVKLTLLDHRENAVFRVDDKLGGKRYALRIHRAGYHSNAALESELQWMAALTEAGVATPTVIEGLDGRYVQVVDIEKVPEPRQCDLFGWIEGVTLGELLGQSPDEASISQAYQLVGRVTAQVHVQARGWTPSQGFIRHSWDEKGLLGSKPLWGGFWELDKLTEAQSDLLLRARNRVRELLMDFGKGTDRYGLIHADLLPDNIMMDGDNPRIIDFDDAGYGWHLYDLATALFSYQGTKYYEPMRAAWITGYRTVKELPDEHLQLLPPLLLARGLIGLGWLHSRQETAHAKAVTQKRIEKVCLMARELLNADTSFQLFKV